MEKRRVSIPVSLAAIWILLLLVMNSLKVPHHFRIGIYLNLLENNLEKNKFLFGNIRGFADIGIAPFIRQFAHVDIDWFLNSDWPNLIAWYQDFVEWKSFKSIMVKHPKWAHGQPMVIFP